MASEIHWTTELANETIESDALCIPSPERCLASRRVNGEAGVRVTEQVETVIVLLTSRVPQGKLDMFSIDFDIGHIVLEHGRNVNLAGNMSDTDTKTPTPRAVSAESATHTLSESPLD